jgi:hypothetical protein
MWIAGAWHRRMDVARGVTFTQVASVMSARDRWTLARKSALGARRTWALLLMRMWEAEHVSNSSSYEVISAHPCGKFTREVRDSCSFITRTRCSVTSNIPTAGV